MEKNARTLQASLCLNERVELLERLAGTDVQTYYGFCLRVQGVDDIKAFRMCLAAKLGLPVTGAYAPLDKVPALATANDPRFRHLGSRLAMPLFNCHRAHYGEAVRFRHNVLLSEPQDLQFFAETFRDCLSATMS